MRKILRVNPILCDGSGVCSELVPERVELDSWGYPMVSDAPIGPGLLPHAKRAVSLCPKLALRLEDAPDDPGRGNTHRS